MERYLDVKFQLDLYDSPRRWRTTAQARREWAALGTETERLRIMRQQILMYSLGLAIEEAHHPWSDGDHNFTSAELLDWLCNTVLPLAKKLEKEKRLPAEPVIEGRCLPALPRLGTTSNLGVGCVETEGEEMETFKERCLKEYARRVENDEIDVLSEKQALIAPPRDRTMRGYEIEMFFGHPTNDWYRGKVVGVVNAKPDVVKIAWDKKGLHADDKAETIEKLIAKKYNPKKTKEGAWRQFFP